MKVRALQRSDVDQGAHGLSVRDLDDGDDGGGTEPSTPAHPLLTDEGSAFWRPAQIGIYEARYEEERGPGEERNPLHVEGKQWGQYIPISPWLLVELQHATHPDVVESLHSRRMVLDVDDQAPKSGMHSDLRGLDPETARYVLQLEQRANAHRHHDQRLQARQDALRGKLAWRLLDPWAAIEKWDERQKLLWQYGFWRAGRAWMLTNPDAPEPPVYRILPRERAGRWHVDAIRRDLPKRDLPKQNVRMTWP